MGLASEIETHLIALNKKFGILQDKYVLVEQKAINAERKVVSLTSELDSLKVLVNLKANEVCDCDIAGQKYVSKEDIKDLVNGLIEERAKNDKNESLVKERANEVKHEDEKNTQDEVKPDTKNELKTYSEVKPETKNELKTYKNVTDEFKKLLNANGKAEDSEVKPEQNKNVPVPELTKSYQRSNPGYKCWFCDKSLFGQRGLNSHILAKHDTQINTHKG